MDNRKNNIVAVYKKLSGKDEEQCMDYTECERFHLNIIVNFIMKVTVCLSQIFE